jgi:hypothetical protein
MARLPDYRAQRGLNVGPAQKLSADRSRLQRFEQLGGAVEEAGQGATQMAQRNAAMRNKQDKTEAIEKHQQFHDFLQHGLEEVAGDVPANGRGLYQRFMSEVFEAQARRFLDDIPESQQALFAERVAQDEELFADTAAMRERDQGYEHAADVVTNSRARMLDLVLPDNLDAHLQRFVELVEAAPLPADQRAQFVDEATQIARFKAVRNALMSGAMTGFELVLDQA